MFAGHRPQLRRSSKIRQQSFPKSTSTEAIDLVQSSSASEPDDNMDRQTKIYRKSGNKAKVTAGRPVEDPHHTTVYLCYCSHILNVNILQNCILLKYLFCIYLPGIKRT